MVPDERPTSRAWWSPGMGAGQVRPRAKHGYAVTLLLRDGAFWSSQAIARKLNRQRVWIAHLSGFFHLRQTVSCTRFKNQSIGRRSGKYFFVWRAAMSAVKVGWNEKSHLLASLKWWITWFRATLFSRPEHLLVSNLNHNDWSYLVVFFRQKQNNTFSNSNCRLLIYLQQQWWY